MKRCLCALLIASSCVLISALCGSCAALGVAANAIPQYEHAKYTGLQGHSVGVMVWADRGVVIDWGTIQLDLANSIQNKLQTGKTDETKGVTWPWPAASIVKYQRDHPSVDAMPAVDIAPSLGVQRLIYVEVQQFRTRSETALELFRGQATVSLRIIEINNGTAKIAYTADNLRATYPPKTPEDGIPNVGDAKIYVGTVDALATEIVNQLVTHEEER